MRDWENNIRKVVPYTPGEQPKNTCVIKLNTNENPYPPAPGVKEVLSNFNTDDLRLYPDPKVDKLVNAIADFYKIDSSKVFVGVGSDDVLAMIFMTFFNSKKPILFPDITYSFYDVWADMLRIPYEQLPLSDDFSIVPSDYYKANGGVVFPNPNAPTGKLMPLAEIEDIIEHNQDVIVADASDFKSAEETVSKVKEEFGRIDVLVNNAGITMDTLLLRMTEEQWDKVVNTNLKSAFNYIHAVIPVMMRQRSGSIVSLSSVVGEAGECSDD